ncbi:hypothetical protein D3C72_2437490 [compost metagenome]
MPICQPTGKGPDHLPVLTSGYGTPPERSGVEVILARNDWGELTYFMREVESLSQMQP